MAACGLGESGQRAGVNFLVWPGGAVDQGGQGVADEPGGLQFVRDGIETGDAHVDDDCLVRLGEGLPVEVDGVVLEVAGDEHATLRVVAVRQWEAEAGGGAEGSGDAGNDFNGNTSSDQLIHLLAAPAKNEGVAAFEANDKFAFECLIDEQLADILLRHGVLAGHFADENTLGGGRDEIKNAVADEVVVDDDFSLLQQARAFECDQLGVAGASTDQGDAAKRSIRVGRGGRGHFSVGYLAKLGFGGFLGLIVFFHLKWLAQNGGDVVFRKAVGFGQVGGGFSAGVRGV